TFRLKHASAVQLAPVLMNLFSGITSNGRGGPGTAVVPNGNGGFNVFGGNAAQPPGNVTTGNQGVTNIQTPFGGRGGNGRGGGGGGGGGGGNAANAQGVILNQLANAFQQAAGSLSNQAGDIRIIAEESSNSLLIRATEADFALVQQIIQGVDL